MLPVLDHGTQDVLRVNRRNLRGDGGDVEDHVVPDNPKAQFIKER